ncbi:twin-arginine translocase TatA/TatE family subunit [Pedobacter borealis]|uniref:twin-arginine translocase TatA/TatE family subunit n=1 Tax=Pedobacter borealis TaxID=475254 RepID=UPI000493AE8A|nr:twin-arginine translocase TatA/TatE family subunit [Pedobacter borealis]
MLNTTIAAMLGTPEIIIIAIVVLLLFGGKKIPELMRGLGKGVKEFKDGKDGVDGEQVDPSNRDKTV